MLLFFAILIYTIPGPNCNRFTLGEHTLDVTSGCEDIVACELVCSEFVPNCPQGGFFDLGPLMNEGFDGLQAYKLCCSRRLFTVTQQPKVVFNLYNQLIENYTGLQAPSFEEILDNDSRQWTVAYTQYFQSVQTQIGWVKDQVAEALAQWVYAIRSFQKLCTHQINWNLRSNLMEKFTVFEAGYELRAVNMQPYDAYADPGLIAYNSLFQWQSDLKSATDRTTIQELNTTINDFQTLKYALLNQIFTLIQNEKLDDYCKCADFKRFFDTISSDTPADVQRVYGMNQASIVQKFPAYYDKMTQYCNQQIPLLLLQFNKNYIQSKNCSSKQMKHSKSIEPTSINSLIPLLFENIKKTGDSKTLLLI